MPETRQDRKPGPTVIARLDALLPPEMAEVAERVGVEKTRRDAVGLTMLAVIAGADIAFGAIFSTTVASEAGALPYGVGRLLAGLVFSLGLILVVVGGAELFTGNNLMVMAWASRHVSTVSLLRAWGIVYVGNFVGGAGTAAMVFLSGQYRFGGGAVGRTALTIAEGKTALPFLEAMMLGVLCNVLVCLAVWVCFGARSMADRILAILFPIAAFVAAGFEHSVANMYFITIGLMIRAWAGDPFWADIGATPADFPSLDLAGLVANLVPVTMGNIIGGGILVGAVYWFIYLRPRRAAGR